jgi:type VI secretion system protein ImpJ
MTRAVRKPVWYEGMPVSPHHLQCQDAYHEALLDARIQAIEPRACGVLRVTFDAASLATGEVRITTLDAVMPHGAVVCVRPDHDDASAPASRSLGRLAPRGSEGVPVYVGVPAQRSGGANVHVQAGGTMGADHARFRRVDDVVTDFNTGRDERSVPWARPRLVVLFGGEDLDGYEVMQVAEIARRDTGELCLREGFVPVVLRIDAVPWLTQQLGELLAALAVKRAVLAHSFAEREAGRVDFGASDVTRFWFLHTVNGFIPSLQHMLRGPTHPESLYLALCALAGQLATFSPAFDLAQIPAYDGEDLGRTFGRLFAVVRGLLTANVSNRCARVTLARSGDGFLVAELGDPRVLTRGTFYLGIHGDTDPGTLATRVPAMLKIASRDRIDGIIHFAVPGVSLEVAHRPPAEIPVKDGRTYFRLVQSGTYWNEIVASGTLAIYQPERLGRVQIECMVIHES